MTTLEFAQRNLASAERNLQRAEARNDPSVENHKAIIEHWKTIIKEFEWHDLRKNPKDLPAESDRLYLAWDNYFEEPKLWRGRVLINTQFDDIIAWKEVEPFEEDE